MEYSQIYSTSLPSSKKENPGIGISDWIRSPIRVVRLVCGKYDRLEKPHSNEKFYPSFDISNTEIWLKTLYHRLTSKIMVQRIFVPPDIWRSPSSGLGRVGWSGWLGLCASSLVPVHQTSRDIVLARRAAARLKYQI